MRTLQVKDLQNLNKSADSSTKISVFIPLYSAPNQFHKDEILFKNTISQITESLNKRGLDKGVVNKTVGRFQRELNKLVRGRPDGTLLMYDDGKLKSFFMPQEIEYKLFIGPRFLTSPLKDVTNKDVNYYLLVLSQKDIRLFRGNNLEIEKLDFSEHKIKPMIKELQIDEILKDLQAHTVGGGGTRSSEAFHGHGVFKDVHKKLIDKYFRIVDNEVSKYLEKNNDAVILAGVRYLTVLYKDVSKLRRPLIIGPSGNFDDYSVGQLINEIKSTVSTLG